MRTWLALIFLLSAFIGQADAEVFKQNQDSGGVQSSIKSFGNNIRRLWQKKSPLNTQLADIEKLYGQSVALLRSLQNQAELKRRNLAKIRQDMQDLHDEVEKQNQGLASQIKAAYAMGQQEKLKLLLNQQDPALSSRMLVYYDYLNKARLKKLADITEAMLHLNQLDKQQQLETELLETTLAQKQTEQLAMDDVKKQRSELLKQLKSEFSSNEQQMVHLQESENKLKNLVSSLQKSSIAFEQNKKSPKAAETVESKELPDSGDDFSKLKGDFSSLKGQLPWPIKGKLASKFGSTRTESAESVWDGVLLDAGEGTEIRAITDGKVVFSDWMRGYGLLVIIDHGKGYMTLYAFNQSLFRQSGDWVNSGDVIASVGQSGGRSHSGLYFGIRSNSKPVDPQEWCRK